MNAITEGFMLDEQESAPDAEMALLGALMLDNSAFDRVADRLRPEHFFSEKHRVVYAEITKQIGKGEPCDVVSVALAVQSHCSLVELHEMAQYVPSAAGIRRFADVVIERSQSRALMAVSSEISDLAQDHDRPIGERVDAGQALLSKLVEDAPRDDWIGAYEGMLEHTQVLEERSEGKREAIPTGLSDLDEFLEGGLRVGELAIIGARPSMGKTALGLSIGVHIARTRSVGFLSMEMTHQEVRDRLTAMLGHVTLSDVKRPAHGKGLAWDRVMDGVEAAKKLRLYTSDQGGLNLNQVRTKARNLRRLHGIDVLLVDYIGLMTGLDQKQNRNTQLGEISRGLKALGKELGCAILCLAQLNRQAEERPNDMPQMRDLRDSGEIEQDADVILFIKRPIMVNPDLGGDWTHYAKLRVAKNRQGRCGDLDLFYQGDRTLFTGWSGPAPSKNPPTAHGKRGGGSFE